MADDGLSVNVNQQLSIKLQNETVFPMRVRDWSRIRRQLEAVGKSRRELSAAAWTCVGVTVSSGFAALSWLPAYSALTADQRAELAAIWPIIIVTGIASAFLAAFLFMAARAVTKHQGLTIELIVEEMNEIHDERDAPIEAVREPEVLGSLRGTAFKRFVQ